MATVEEELRVSQELLFLILDKVGPIELDIEESKEKSMQHKMIDADLNADAGTLTLSVVDTDA